MLREFNLLIQAKCLRKCFAYSKHLINIIYHHQHPHYHHCQWKLYCWEESFCIVYPKILHHCSIKSYPHLSWKVALYTPFPPAVFFPWSQSICSLPQRDVRRIHEISTRASSLEARCLINKRLLPLLVISYITLALLNPEGSWSGLQNLKHKQESLNNSWDEAITAYTALDSSEPSVIQTHRLHQGHKSTKIDSKVLWDIKYLEVRALSTTGGRDWFRHSKLPRKSQVNEENQQVISQTEQGWGLAQYGIPL